MIEQIDLDTGLNSFFHQVPIGLYVTDPEGRVVEVNQTLLEMLGFPNQQVLLATDVADLYVNPSDRARWREELQREGVLHGTDVQVRRYDGTTMWVRHTANAVRDSQGQVRGFAGVVEDITARRAEMAEHFREAQRRRRVGEGLRDILATLNEDRPLAEILDYIATLARKLLGSDAVAIYRLDAEAGVLRIQAARGLDPDYVANMFVKVGYGAVGQAIVTREPVAIGDLSAAAPEDPNSVLDPPRQALLKQLSARYHALLGVPLLIKEQAYGGMALYYLEPRKFTFDEISLAAMFGAQTALAIENARLRAQAEQAAVAAERTRLARDLHDSVTQLLYSLSLMAEAGREKAERGDLQRVQAHLAEIGETAQQALKEMRLLVHDLRPPVLEREGLVGALNQRLDAVERRAGIDAHLLSENWCELPPSIEEELYHIARETLNNALKHAAATSVTVQLRRTADDVILEITNNGRSFDPAFAREGGGLGLIGMLERAEKLGGQLTISSEADRGTRVIVRVPVSGV